MYGRLRHKCDSAGGLEWTHGANQLPKVSPLDVSHSDEQLPLRFARLIDGHHVRVIERSGRPRFASEPRAEAGVLRQLRRQYLQGDASLQPCVLRQVDDTHATAAEHRLDPVPGERRPMLELTRHRAALPR